MNFIMMGYNIPPSRENKKTKSKRLVETLKISEVMPSPEKLSQTLYDDMKTSGNTSIPVVNTQETEQGAENMGHPTTSTNKGMVQCIASQFVWHRTVKNREYCCPLG
jgi:hypothetical protein